MTPSPATAAANTISPWTPQWSPDHTDPNLPPLTVIADPHDQPAYTTTALAAHNPREGRIAVHPTPLGTAPAYLAHDLIRALGKHLPPPHIDPPYWTGNADQSWRVVAAWTEALGIGHYIVCRAHRLTGRHLEHLMALRERTRIHLTLVLSGPPSSALTQILDAIAHTRLDTTTQADHHVHSHHSDAPTTNGYPWWQVAAFPSSETEPWYQLPPRPRRPPGRPDEITTSCRGTPTRLPSDDNPPPARALAALTDKAPHPGEHHEVVAHRIHTRIAHPVDAAAVAIRALTGYGTDQLSSLQLPTPSTPRAHLPAHVPDWASLLLDAARIHTCLEGHAPSALPAHLSGTNRPFRLGAWQRNDIAHATETCRLLTAP
ncbi:hypothetical protein ABZ892_31670 [Streptomyces sp. NPDC046924]|uniref:hypothetical protein n=1 Tax=Streptomyces sp. NPDC046924 TaxID=3155136 RepID=UPI0033CB8246